MEIKQPVLILSDLHLGSKMSRAKEFLEFLNSAKFETLILNGDIIDNPNLQFFTREHWDTLNYLKKLCNSGKRVIWVSGNHDAFAKSLFKMFGLETHIHFSFLWNDKKCLVLHGHQYDKFLIRNTFLSNTMNSSYRVIQKIDGKKQLLSRFVKRRYKVWLRVSKRVAKGAIKYGIEKGADYVFCGHTHEFLTMKSGRITYINSGAWVDRTCSFISLDDEIKLEVIN